MAQSDVTNWTGAAGDGDWPTAANWSNGLPAASGSYATLSGRTSAYNVRVSRGATATADAVVLSTDGGQGGPILTILGELDLAGQLSIGAGTTLDLYGGLIKGGSIRQADGGTFLIKRYIDPWRVGYYETPRLEDVGLQSLTLAEGGAVELGATADISDRRFGGNGTPGTITLTRYNSLGLKGDITGQQVDLGPGTSITKRGAGSDLLIEGFGDHTVQLTRSGQATIGIEDDTKAIRIAGHVVVERGDLNVNTHDWQVSGTAEARLNGRLYLGYTDMPGVSTLNVEDGELTGGTFIARSGGTIYLGSEPITALRDTTVTLDGDSSDIVTELEDAADEYGDGGHVEEQIADSLQLIGSGATLNLVGSKIFSSMYGHVVIDAGGVLHLDGSEARISDTTLYGEDFEVGSGEFVKRRGTISGTGLVQGDISVGDGTIEAADGGLLRFAGDVNRLSFGTSSFQIWNGSTLQFDKAADGDTEFRGEGNVLALKTPWSYSGTVGGALLGNAIDLVGITGVTSALITRANDEAHLRVSTTSSQYDFLLDGTANGVGVQVGQDENETGTLLSFVPPSGVAAPRASNVYLGVFRAEDGKTAEGTIDVSNEATGVAAQTLKVAIAAAQGVTASGSIPGLKPGTSDGSIKTLLDLGQAGHRKGTVELGFTSMSDEDGNTDLPSQTVSVEADVYREGKPEFSAEEVILHVGDSGTQATTALIMKNSATADGFSEGVRAAVTGFSGPGLLSAVGQTGLVKAGSQDGYGMEVVLDTTKPGEIAGTVGVAIATDGIGTSGLGILKKATQSVEVKAAINNFAEAQLGGGKKIIDLGTFELGKGQGSLALAAANVAQGTSDLLRGVLSGSGSALFSMSTKEGRVNVKPDNPSGLKELIRDQFSGELGTAVGLARVAGEATSGIFKDHPAEIAKSIAALKPSEINFATDMLDSAEALADLEDDAALNDHLWTDEDFDGLLSGTADPDVSGSGSGQHGGKLGGIYEGLGGAVGKSLGLAGTSKALASVLGGASKSTGFQQALSALGDDAQTTRGGLAGGTGLPSTGLGSAVGRLGGTINGNIGGILSKLDSFETKLNDTSSPFASNLKKLVRLSESPTLAGGATGGATGGVFGSGKLGGIGTLTDKLGLAGSAAAIGQIGNVLGSTKYDSLFKSAGLTSEMIKDVFSHPDRTTDEAIDGLGTLSNEELWNQLENHLEKTETPPPPAGGLASFSGLMAGQSTTAGNISFNPSALGTFSYNVTLDPTGYHGGVNPYAGLLGQETATIIAHVVKKKKWPPDPPKREAEAHGDVHLRAFDGSYYDFQAAGEFVLTRSNAGTPFEVQTRLQETYKGSGVTVNTQAGVGLGEHKVSVAAFGGGLRIDGAAVTLAVGATQNLGDGRVTRVDDGTVTVTDATGDIVTIRDFFDHLDLNVGLSANRADGSVEGLLGNGNGSSLDDLKVSGGSILQGPTAAQLYGSYADTWRVRQTTSLLAYGAGETTETYTDRNVPGRQFTLDDLPAEIVARALAAAEAAGITDPVLKESAAYDLIVTGDAAFVEGAKAVQEDGVSGVTTNASASSGAPSSLVGISALALDVPASNGPTTVTFKVYRTGATTEALTLGYSVQAPGADYFSASDFPGGVVPTGEVTIAAGQSEATFTVAAPLLPQNDPTQKLRVAITAPNGSDATLVAASADVAVTASNPTRGVDAAALLLDVAGGGMLVHSGNAWTLDLGAIARGSSVSDVVIGVLNAGGKGANALSGTFADSGSGFAVEFSSVAGLAAGRIANALVVSLDTSTAGTFTETVTLSPTQSNASGFADALPDLTLTLSATITADSSVPVVSPPGSGGEGGGLPSGGTGTAPTSGADRIVGSDAPEIIRAGGGDDTVSGGVGDDVLYGNLGNDRLSGDAGSDTLHGGQGNDLLLGGPGADLAIGGLGDDQVFGNEGSDTLSGNPGSDSLSGGQGDDLMFGGQGTDLLSGNMGADVVCGNLGDDRIYGGQGNDTLYGGQGNDTLYGNLGDDILIGNRGADRLVFGPNGGADLVIGFSVSDGDRLDLSGQTYRLDSAADGSASLILSGGGSLTLAGISASSVGAGFFV